MTLALRAGRGVRRALTAARQSALGVILGALAAHAGLAAGASGAPSPATPVEGEALSQGVHRIPHDAVLVLGARPLASDPVTPLPEGGVLGVGVYRNAYFGLRWGFPQTWSQKLEGPPPSDSGYYVLAQLDSAGSSQGTVLITARDLFFTPLPGKTALELVQSTLARLQAPVYQIDQPPEQVQVAGRSFVQLAYSAPVAGLHWWLLATLIRCHLVQFLITSPAPRFIGTALEVLQGLELPAAGPGGGDAPVCIAGYASDAHLVRRVEPILPAGRMNPIPVRIIIDRAGRVRHIHFISAFPDQAAALTPVLQQWRFKPYLMAGKAVEVETGILFGRAPRPRLSRRAR